MEFEKIPRIWLFLSGIVFIIGLVTSSVLASGKFTLGYASGGALVLLNAWASAWRIRKSGFQDRGRSIVALIGGFYFRLIFLGLCLFVLVRFTEVDPIGLVTGLSVVPASLFLMLSLIYISNRRPKEV
ncbi:MAG: ATP synthase subunit I [Pseudomonadota bacterium]